MAQLDNALRVSHLTISPSNVVTQSMVGHFSQTKDPELLCVKGNGQWLQLSALISSSLHSICTANIFGEIRTLNKVPSSNPSHQTDCIAITTMAGKLMILQFDHNKRSQNALQCFRIITEYEISKNGCLPTEVGQYAQCIPMKQKDQYLFFVSAPFERHLFLRLTSSV